MDDFLFLVDIGEGLANAEYHIPDGSKARKDENNSEEDGEAEEDPDDFDRMAGLLVLLLQDIQTGL